MPFFSIRAGKICSLKMEVNLTDHCNYRCRECSHFSPLMPVRFASLETFRQDLVTLSRGYHVQRLRFVGGEPLLHPEVTGFVRAARQSGIADRIQVQTNGSLLERLDEEFFREIDMLSISRYPDGRCDPRQLQRASEMCRRHGKHLQLEDTSRFRVTQIENPLGDESLVESIFRSCAIAHVWYCQTFYDGVFYLCSRPIFTGAYLRACGREDPDFRIRDGIPLHETNLLARLEKYLQCRRPLASCRYCLGTVGRTGPWQSLPASRGKPQPRTRLSAAELLDQRRMQRLLRWAGLRKVLLWVVPSLMLCRVLGLLQNAVLAKNR